MSTRREYLVTLGLARAGRGKFSTAAHEALAKAEAEGMTFDLTPAEVAKLDREVKKAAKGNAPKDAPAEGETLQKAATVTETPKVKEETADKNNYSPAAPRTRQSTTFVGKDGGTEVKVDDKTGCVKCGWSFSHCTCFTPNDAGQIGPFLYASKGGTDSLVSFVGV